MSLREDVVLSSSLSVKDLSMPTMKAFYGNMSLRWDRMNSLSS